MKRRVNGHVTRVIKGSRVSWTEADERQVALEATPAVQRFRQAVAEAQELIEDWERRRDG